MTESWHSAKRPGNRTWEMPERVDGAAARRRAVGGIDDDDPHIIGQVGARSRASQA